MTEIDKPVLDATCGSRMIWFNKNNPLALYVDRRELYDEKIWKSTKNDSVRTCNIHPDIIADFTNLPFENETFYHIVFDPPHIKTLSETAWLCKKYGKLPENWEQVIHDGFCECMRVLKPYGTLIFKWNEFEIPIKKIIEVIGYEPMYGNRSGKTGKTHWMAFIKTGGVET